MEDNKQNRKNDEKVEYDTYSLAHDKGKKIKKN